MPLVRPVSKRYRALSQNATGFRAMLAIGLMLDVF